MSKPIQFSAHALQQMELRGATEPEVVEAIQMGEWQPAKRGKYQSRRHFVFGLASPINQQVYRFKTVDVIFVEEPTAIVIVTVKVYYSNEERSS